MTTTEELLFYLARTTLALAAAVVLTALLLRVARVTSPAVHRVGCILALLVGWTFLQWPVRVPWYETPAPVAEVMALDEPPAPPEAFRKSSASLPEPLIAIAGLGAPEETAPATIELPHIDLTQPLAVSEPPTEAISQPVVADAPPIATAPLEPAMEMPTEPEPATAVEIEDEVVAINALLPVASTWEIRDFAPHAAAVWAGGICLLVVAWLLGYARFLRRLPEGRDADAEWLDQWQALLADHDVRRAVPLRVTADMGPMLCRLPRGYELLVPEPLWQELNATERAAILRHELAHLVRRDVWKSLGVRVLALPHWFNPFAWWAVRRFDEAAEWACDRAASGDHATTTYARALVRLGEVAGRHASYSPAAMGRPLAARIRRLLAGRLREDSSVKKALLLAACTGFALAALVRVELVAREAAKQDASVRTEPADAPLADDASVATDAPNNDAGAQEASDQHPTTAPPASSGLLALAAELRAGDAIHLTADEIAARGLRLVSATAAPPEEVRLRGQTSLISDRTSFVRPLLPGHVKHIATVAAGPEAKPRRVGVGTVVKKGQVLAQIWNMDVNDKEIDLVAAYAEQELAQEGVNRLRSVAEKGAVSALALREAEHQVQVNRIAINKIERTIRAWSVDQEDIEKLKTLAAKINSQEDKSLAANDVPGTYPIVSPIDGTVLERNVNVGDVVDGAQKLFIVADLSHLQILAQTTLGIVPRLKELPPDARRWSVVAPYFPWDDPLEGTFAIDSIVEREPNRVLLHGDVDNRKGLLRASQAVTATITFPADAEAVMIPARAVIDDGGGWVFVQAKDDPTRFERRGVASQGRQGPKGFFVVRSSSHNEPGAVASEGLAAGEKLLAAIAAENAPKVPSAPAALKNTDQEAEPVAQPTRDTASVGRGDGAAEPLATGPATPRYPDVIEAARAGFEAARRAYDQDTITLDEVCAWSVRLLNAEGSSELVVENEAEADIPGGPDEPGVRSPNDDERIGFTRAHLARMKELQARVLALYKIGARGGEAEKKALMDYYVADAERSLKRLQNRQAQQQRARAALASVGRDATAEADSERPTQGIRFSHSGTKPNSSPRKLWREAPDSGRERLRYGGRSFADWIAQVDTELDTMARREAIAALTAFGQRGYGPEVTKKLIELLADDEQRENAIRGLGRLGPTAVEAISALEEAAKEDRYRRDAQQALSLIRGEKIDISPQFPENSEARAEQLRREAKLMQLLAEKRAELARDALDVERLQKRLGILKSGHASAQMQMLQQQLTTVNSSIFSHTAQLSNLEVEIDKIKLDIDLARDPAAREARAEEETHKDEKLRKLEEQRRDLELATAEATNQIKSKDNPTLKRLSKSLAAVEEKIELRRDELLKRFSDADEAIKLKEYEGKLKAAEKHRDAVKKQLEDLAKPRDELIEKTKVLTLGAAELEVKERKVLALEQLIEELKRDLQKLQVQHQSSQAGDAKSNAAVTNSASPQPSAKASTQDMPASPEAKLREQLTRKNDELVRGMQEVDVLTKKIETLRRELTAVNEKIADHTRFLDSLDREIEQYRRENKQKPNRPLVWLLGQSELSKDEKLQKLAEQKKELERAIAGTQGNAKSDGDPTLERLKESLTSTEEKITARADELRNRFAESDEFTNAGKEALLKMAEERRENIAASIEQWKQEREQLAKKLLPLTLRGCEFEVKRRGVEELQQVVERLNRDLYRAQLEAQLSGSDASLLARDEPAAVVRGNRVVAYLKILRNPEHLSSKSRQADSHEFLVRRSTTLEVVRSKALLARVVQKQNIAELPIVQTQADPVQWLHDNLQLRYPNDAELLEVAMEGRDVEQLKAIVNTVVDVYFQEVVTKSIEAREKKAAKLKQLYDIKVAALENDRKRLEPLEKLTQELGAALKKIDAERNSPSRVERVPESPPVAPTAPQSATPAAAPAEAAKPAAAPAPSTAAPQAPPEAASQPDAESSPPDEAKLRH